jgi:hypothetical protein
MIGPLGVVADRKEPILDREPNPFLDERPGHAWHAGAVRALPDELFEVADRGKCQRNRDSIGFGFFSGHIARLACKMCTEKNLFRLFGRRPKWDESRWGSPLPVIGRRGLGTRGRLFFVF